MTHAAETFQPLQPDDPRLVAGYRIAARLGAGGMGRVYLSHTDGGRPVAIKVVRPELADAPAFRQRFRREITAARRVRGAYTAELIDADADGTPPWLATLYVPGPSLTQAVARRGPLPPRAVLWLMAGVAEALEAIHAAGIVHRDLKPSNVLLASDGPRVIDFGISLASDVTSYTVTGSAVGTPSFMAPEQASAGDVTAATDVFALGQTAAFAALGEPLYGDGPSVSVLYRIVHSEPELSRLPEELRPLIARCLAAEPADRITPAEIVAWCRRHLADGAGADGAEGTAGGAGGPAIWREVAGPEAAVPAPVPQETAIGTLPFGVHPPAANPASVDEEGARKARRRRRALFTAASVAAGALTLAGVIWGGYQTLDRLRDQERKESASQRSAGPLETGEKSGVSASPDTSKPGSGKAAADTGGGTGTGTGTGTGGTGTGTRDDGWAWETDAVPGKPRPIAHPMVWFDRKNSVSFTEPVTREDRRGDMRLTCRAASCALESDRSVFVMVYGDPGTGPGKCRAMLAQGGEKRLPLAAAAAGSEICVKHPSGDIGLLVLQVKSTAMPEHAFVTADLTVWRAEGA
ncbi:serine/threonine-protein kinase [Streptomyces sp. NPDC006798]|uniref:serine/threonine-protein kinase n=1 Tax=Streptomyces sp. NPDC006798 TaxID=3155462 RepID=UPI0033E940FC